MYKTNLIGVIVISLFQLMNALVAQEIPDEKALSLEEALVLASENNREVKKALADIEAAKADNLKAHAAFLPSVELSTGLMSSNDPLNAFGFKLQQQSVTAADFDPNAINDPGTIDQFATQIMVEQPLINLDAWKGKSAASHQLKATELKGEYTKEYVAYLVKQTYYALQLANNRTEVIGKAQSAVDAYLKMAEDNLKQGYLKEADVLAVKVRQYELKAQAQEANNQVRTVSETLNLLLGREISQPVSVSDLIEKVNYDASNALSIMNRSDVLAMQNGMEAYKLKSQSDLMKFAPRINAFGSYNMYDSEIASFDAYSYLVGIKLQWKIFNGSQNIGQYKKSKANYNKAQVNYEDYLAKGNMELAQARRSILVAGSQLQTFQLATEQAKESLRIRTNRYNEGMEQTSDLLMAETKAAESELKYLNAIYNYNVAVFKYQLLGSQATQN